MIEFFKGIGNITPLLVVGGILGGLIYKLLRDKLKDEFVQIKDLEHSFVSKEDLNRYYVSKEKLDDILGPLVKKIDTLQNSIDRISAHLLGRA